MATLNKTEQEVIVLNAIWGMIDDMVNYIIFEKNERQTDVILRFCGSEHMRLFNVLLVDFLSSPQPAKGGGLPFDLPEPSSSARPSDWTHLFYLRQVCASPRLGTDASKISNTLDGFSAWLEATATVEGVWLPSIEIELDMKVSRIGFIKMCGNIAKHNILRLSQNVKRLRNIMKENGHSIDEGQAYLALPDFYEWFHKDIFQYHSSAIAEYLNNLRWGMFEYLLAEFLRAHHKVGPGSMYGYHIPAEITEPLAKVMYYDLMNRVRTRPYMPRFEVSQFVNVKY